MVKSSLFSVAITLSYLLFPEINTIPNMACALPLHVFLVLSLMYL